MKHYLLDMHLKKKGENDSLRGMRKNRPCLRNERKSGLIQNMEEQKTEIKIRKRPLAFTDVETTGLESIRWRRSWYFLFVKTPRQWHEIIELGLVLADQETLEILNTLNIKIKPEHPERLTESALKINGYNAEDWHSAVPLKTAMEKYSELTKDAIFCAQNPTFDWSFINAAFKKTGNPNLMDYHRIDLFTLAWGKLFHTNLERFNQDMVAEFLGFPKEPLPHRAISGAMMAYENYKKLISR